jgi:hypothetical protein
MRLLVLILEMGRIRRSIDIPLRKYRRGGDHGCYRLKEEGREGENFGCGF